MASPNMIKINDSIPKPTAVKVVQSNGRCGVCGKKMIESGGIRFYCSKECRKKR